MFLPLPPVCQSVGKFHEASWWLVLGVQENVLKCFLNTSENAKFSPFFWYTL